MTWALSEKASQIAEAHKTKKKTKTAFNKKRETKN